MDKPGEQKAPNKLGRWLSSLSGYCLFVGSVGSQCASLLLPLLVVIYFLFCVVFLGLRYGVLPNIDRYKPDIERLTSQAIGRKLTISTMSASWEGLNPRLLLGDVVILDQQGRTALVLPDVSATLSWWSVAVADLRFAKIEITRPSLELQRDRSGKLFVAGFFIDTQNSGDGRGLDWVLAQQEIVIRDGALRWNDQLRSTPELVLSDLNFVIKNHWLQHQFALKATPPISLAAPIDIRGSFQHPAFSRKISDFSSWSGELYADLYQADLLGLNNYIDYPAELKKATGTVRSWTRFEKNHLTDLTVDVRLNDVVGKFRNDLPLLDMAQVSGRIVASERVDLGKKYLPSLFGQAGHTLALIGFSMQTRDGVRLPATTIQEKFIPATKGQQERTEIYAKFLDLHSIAKFAEHLPLPADQRQMLIDFTPKGQLKEFTAKWQGRYPELASYSAKGEFINLSMKPQLAQLARPKLGSKPATVAVPAIPGFDNLSGFLDASDKGGSFSLNSSDVALQLPTYFVDPVMPFEKLQMQARWQFEAQDKLTLQVSKMEFQQGSMKASLSGRHVMSMQHSASELNGELDISGKLSGFDLKEINRFIPAQAPEDLRHWLTNALLGGRADDVSIRVKGDLAHFPFSSTDGKLAAKGEFLVKGNLSAGKLDFAPGYFSEDGKSPLWPVIDNIKGSFVFDRAKMEIKGESGKTLGLDLLKVKAVIPDLLTSNAILNIDGSVSGGLQSMLQYVVASPVDAWLGHFLQESKATGNAQLGLKLQLPLNHIVDSKVQGGLQFLNNEVALQTNIPLISAVNGKLDFNEKGLNLTSLKGNSLGGAVVATGGTQKDSSIRIKLDGIATADGLRKNFPGATIDRLSGKITGSAHYTAQINVRKSQLELIIDSPLQGLALNFPAPLRKLVNENMPLHFQMSPVASADTALVRDDIRFTLGSAISARYQRQKEDKKNASWQMLRGGIGVNVTAPEPDSGLSANIDFKSVNIDEWRALMAHAAAPAPANNPASTAGGMELSSYIEPDVLAARTAELIVMGKRLENVVVGASHQRGVWQANIDASQVSGYLRWNESGSNQSSNQGAGNVTARLSRLTIPKSAESDVSDLLEGKNTSTQIPGLDIVVENFELFNKKLGQLELLASNVPALVGREWQIKKLLLRNDDAELKGTGKWSGRSGEGTTDLKYVLEMENAGKLLDRFGFPNVMRGGRGKLEGDIRWNGLPYAMDIPSMAGQLQLELAAGQFLKVDPGAAKLLGVLSMQSLPRRLTLDFRDVFSDGFAFDGISGAAQIQQGVARTSNLKMRSVNATVLMDGSADIARESQDVHVAVIPEINAGAASVVYALAVNPVIGLGTFLAQLFLREPLARAFTYEYQITGPWTDPHVAKITNKDAQSKAAVPSAPPK
ncbi:YhdP family protein [soil metagenome]